MFDKAWEYYLELEGGYVDHKYDRGGKTRYGITESTARRHGYCGNMKDLPINFAKQIIKHDYWDRFQGDYMEYEIAEKMLNIAVHAGVHTAGDLLQRVLNTIGAGLIEDGIVGQLTLNALERFSKRPDGVLAIVKYLNALQGEYYLDLIENNPSQRAFYYGWTRRLR